MLAAWLSLTSGGEARRPNPCGCSMIRPTGQQDQAGLGKKGFSGVDGTGAVALLSLAALGRNLHLCSRARKSRPGRRTHPPVSHGELRAAVLGPAGLPASTRGCIALASPSFPRQGLLLLPCSPVLDWVPVAGPTLPPTHRPSTHPTVSLPTHLLSVHALTH